MKLSMDTSILTVQRNLSKSNKSISTLIERLSTGSKINKAADDAANLSVSKQMESQSSGLKVANDNISQGNDLIETADGALSEMTEQLQRLRDLAVQAANGIYSDEERTMLQTEANSIVDGVYQTKNNATYNDINVLGQEDTIGIERGKGYHKATSKTAEELDIEYGVGNWSAINSRADLEAIPNNSSETYVLMSDIDLSDSEWISKGFNGTFDGNGYAITNMNINKPTSEYIGLFSASTNATIKNLELLDVNISGNACVGGIIGRTIECTIDNCRVTGTLSTGGKMGGIAGEIQSNTNITNCSTSVNITGGAWLGGFVGNIEGENSIENSYSDAVINSSCSAIGNVGGFAGANNGKGSIKHCYSTGTIFADFHTVGGLIGKNYGTIENCYSSVEINSSAGSGNGGLIGDNLGDVKNCYATGNVTSSGNCTGGLIGNMSSGSLTNVYATGNVVLTDSSKIDTGGLIGTCSNISITNAYSSGNVTGGYYTGGLIGSSKNVQIQNACATGDIIANASYTGGFIGVCGVGDDITNSYSSGTIIRPGYSTGGFVSNLTGNISNSITSTYISRKSDKNGSFYVTKSDTSELSNTYSLKQQYTNIPQTGPIEKESEWFDDRNNWQILGDKFDYSSDQPTVLMGDSRNISIQITANSNDVSEKFYLNSCFTLGNFSVDFSSSENAQASIDKIDTLLNTITRKRSSIGTTSNILSSIQISNQIKIENLEASLSTIVDTDIAKTSSELTKHQILQQSSASLLSQCGDIDSTNALSLLNGSKLY